MTLKQIAYFQCVCAKGNISAAAEELFISRSVISRALMELEEEFDTQIFLRSKNGVVLTESGEILARLFQEFNTCYSATKSRLQQLNGQSNYPILRLGVTPTNAYTIYQRYYDAFHRAYPEIHMRIEEYSANEAWQLLLEGTVDAFFTPARILDQNMFDTLELYQVQVMLGVPAQCMLAEQKTLGIADIVDLPLGYLNAPMPVEDILTSCFQTYGKKPRVALRTSSQALLQELTERGLIYSILPSDMLESWTGIKSIPLDFFQASTHRLAWNRVLPHSAPFNTFIDFMRTQAAT